MVPLFCETNSSSKHQFLNNRWMLFSSFVAAIIFVYLFSCLFHPTWMTNDDVGMSMIAHGYGAVAVGSPNLTFSNVLWGYMVRLIPEVNGVLGYSIATLSVLVLVGTTLIYGLLKLGFSYLTTLVLITLILVRPVLFPQFTINAGLLMVSAIVCWILYVRQNNKYALFAGGVLAFLSYLVRSHEFVLILVVALPLVPWQYFFRQRASKLTVLVLILAIAGSAYLDQLATQGSEWQSFNLLNPVRALFTDYGAGRYLAQRTDILQQHGYSVNDINLISSWFFVDPNIANPKILKVMLDQLGPIPGRSDGLMKAWQGIQTFWDPTLLPLVLTALVLAVLRPNWRVAVSWVLSIVAMSTIGFLGRPSVLHVYIALVSLLLLAPFLVQGTHYQVLAVFRHRLAIVLLVVAAILNTTIVIQQNNAKFVSSELIRKGLRNFPTSSVLIWGAVFPFEATYQVLKQTPAAMKYRLYALGVFTLAPFSTSFEEEKTNRITDRLMSEDGILIIADGPSFSYLNIYCKRRLHGKLTELSSIKYGKVKVSRRRCIVPS